MPSGIVKGEWTIVGGTGKFTLAQGAIYYDVVSRTQGGEIKELHIGVFYTTMERSTVRACLVPSKTQKILRSNHHIESCGTCMEY